MIHMTLHFSESEVPPPSRYHSYQTAPPYSVCLSVDVDGAQHLFEGCSDFPGCMKNISGSSHGYLQVTLLGFELSEVSRKSRYVSRAIIMQEVPAREEKLSKTHLLASSSSNSGLLFHLESNLATSCDGRVVKALDLKSNGVSPHRFEPCSQRFLPFFFKFPFSLSTGHKSFHICLFESFSSLLLPWYKSPWL